MPSNHIHSISNALYRVFVQPSLLSKPHSQALLPPLQSTTSLRSFSRTTRRPINRAASFSSPPPEKRNPVNSEITAKLINLVDSETGRLQNDGQVRTTWDVLRSLDLSTHRLVQLTVPPRGGAEDGRAVAVCRIESLEDVRAAEAKKYQTARQLRKARAAGGGKPAAGSGPVVTKTLEINWAIDVNDLGHRMERMRQFLREGKKVEVVLAARKKGRQASPEECRALMEKLRETVESVKGAKERAPLQGDVGKLVTIVFQGPATIEEDASPAAYASNGDEAQKRERREGNVAQTQAQPAVGA